MALRPGRTMRRLERPYTRVSHKVPRKSYVVGVPFPKTHQFEMGNRNGNFDKTLFLVCKRSVQIRDNALEAARVVANKFLEKKLGGSNYFFKILKYPHHVLREKPIATGAGADRYSQGMAHAFGKPVGTAVQVKAGDKLVMVKVSSANFDIAKAALKRFGSKISTPVSIIAA
jgi:large subunit ribosomal protein L10e